MNKKKLITCIWILLLSAGLISCGDNGGGDDETVTPTANGITFTQEGTLELDIKHTFGNTPLDLAPASYITLAKDTIKVSELIYYISNIVLSGTNGTNVNLKGYFLENFKPGQPNRIHLQHVPVGTYSTLSYMIGVDSLANSTAVHEGDLDPMYGMYWPWGGYVFIKINGRYAYSEKKYGFDIGGNKNGMFCSHNLLAYKVSGTSIKAGLKFDIEKVFNAPNVYDLKIDSNFIHLSTTPGIEKFTANIQNAFSLTAVQ